MCNINNVLALLTLFAEKYGYIYDIQVELIILVYYYSFKEFNMFIKALYQ